MRIDKNKLQIAMARACVSDVELSKRSNVPLSTIAHVKRGKGSNKPTTVGKIAAALQCDVTDILKSDREE